MPKLFPYFNPGFNETKPCSLPDPSDPSEVQERPKLIVDFRCGCWSKRSKMSDNVPRMNSRQFVKSNDRFGLQIRRCMVSRRRIENDVGRQQLRRHHRRDVRDQNFGYAANRPRQQQNGSQFHSPAAAERKVGEIDLISGHEPVLRPPMCRCPDEDRSIHRPTLQRYLTSTHPQHHLLGKLERSTP